MSESPKHPASGRIIFVDKDIFMRQMMEMALGEQFQIVTVPTGEKGLELVNAGYPFDIVIASFTLAGMNGLEFLRRTGELYPSTVRILISGGCGDVVDINQAIIEGHISRFVSKPFCLSTLLDQLESDLASVRAIEIAN